jgi:hypothetical protein
MFTKKPEKNIIIALGYGSVYSLLLHVRQDR